MAKKDLPHALTLERFASGKDGRANAFKKKKQGATTSRNTCAQQPTSDTPTLQYQASNSTTRQHYALRPTDPKEHPAPFESLSSSNKLGCGDTMMRGRVDL